MRVPVGPLVAAVVLLAGCGGGSGGVTPPAPVTPSPAPSLPPLAPSLLISRDPFTDPVGQHATEVEPSAASAGNTVVAAFQTGRFLFEGASGIGFAVSYDGGANWSSGTLPSQTTVSRPAGTADSVSDAVVAYDAAHASWLIASVPIAGSTVLGVYVSRSTDATHWSAPVQLPPGTALTDKPWIACDDWPSSRYYGRCYAAWDEGGGNGLIHVCASNDGGATWSTCRIAAGATGIGVEPLVRPDGTVVMPFDDFSEGSVRSTVSSDGGATWSASVSVSPIFGHRVAGGLRAGYLQSAAMDASGTAYVVWPDCRFRTGCASNDLVLSTSPDGLHWSAPQRIPLDAIAAPRDHFITGLAADPAARGRLALTYYFYSQSACTPATCQLYAGFTTSPDGGSTWSSPVALSGPISLSWIANTTQGRMVGDYAASVFVAGRPHGVFAAASPPSGAIYSEAIYYSQ